MSVMSVSAMLPAMDDAVTTCDAGITSSHHHYQHQQLQPIHDPAAYSDWTTSSAEQQQRHINGSTRRRSSCSQRTRAHRALTAADSTTAGPTSTDDALLTNADVGLRLACGLRGCKSKNIGLLRFLDGGRKWCTKPGCSLFC